MNDQIVCKYHEHVVCRKKQCINCGWQPKTEELRKEALMPSFCLDCKYYNFVKLSGKRAYKAYLRKRASLESVQATGKCDNSPGD